MVTLVVIAFALMIAIVAMAYLMRLWWQILIILFPRGRKMMELLSGWAIPLLLTLAGVSLILLRVGSEIAYRTPDTPQIGDISVDGKKEPSYGQLLQSRFATLFEAQPTNGENFGFFEVPLPNADQFWKIAPQPEAGEDQTTLKIKDLDLSPLVKLFRSVRPPAWILEADARAQSDRITLHARLRYGKRIKRQWHLEAAGTLPTEKNKLMEQLIDQLIFHIVRHLHTETQNSKFRALPNGLGPDALLHYTLGRYHLERYNRSRSASDLNAALKHLEDLRWCAWTLRHINHRHQRIVHHKQLLQRSCWAYQPAPAKA